jgi:hypothetical protein
MLSPLEIRAAIKIAEHENGSMWADDATIAVTRLLGFKRTGPDLRAAILKAVRTWRPNHDATLKQTRIVGGVSNDAVPGEMIRRPWRTFS